MKKNICAICKKKIRFWQRKFYDTHWKCNPTSKKHTMIGFKKIKRYGEECLE